MQVLIDDAIVYGTPEEVFELLMTIRGYEEFCEDDGEDQCDICDECGGIIEDIPEEEMQLPPCWYVPVQNPLSPPWIIECSWNDNSSALPPGVNFQGKYGYGIGI